MWILWSGIEDMALTSKQKLLAFIGVAGICALVGAGLAWLDVKLKPFPVKDTATDSRAHSGYSEGSSREGSIPIEWTPKDVQIMEQVEESTITALAVCSSCSLGIGPKTEHQLFLVTQNPLHIFEVLPNDERQKLTKITGSCAVGNIEVTATGRIGKAKQYNIILISKFTTRKVGEGSGTESHL